MDFSLKNIQSSASAVNLMTGFPSQGFTGELQHLDNQVWVFS